jgi:hypothetical protein
MKKSVLCALLLAAVAMSASATWYPGTGQSAGKSYSGPNEGQWYSCDYQNYSGSAIDPGHSYWIFDIFYDGLGRPMLRGTEHFRALDRYGVEFLEGYKATWAAPANFPDPATSGTLNYTKWEYTFNPYGPQCKRATVHFNAFKLVFSECGDGHSRTCWLVQ